MNGIDYREIPSGLPYPGTIVSSPAYLDTPHECYMRGYELRLVEVRQVGGDPYVLYDRWGKIIHQWPEGYTPTWMDVHDVLQK